MAQNIQTANDITDYDKAGIQTVNRPIILSWNYSGSGTPPKIISVQVKVELDGQFVDVGGEQLVTRTQTSAASNPKFEIDVSSFMKGYIQDNLTDLLKSHSASGAPLSSTNTNSNTQRNIIKYKAEARSWYINSEDVLVQNLDDQAVVNPPSGSSLFACDMYIKDEAFIASRFSNMNFNSNASIESKAFAVEGTIGELSDKKFLTNCPSSLTRILPLQSHFFVSVFNRHSLQLNLRTFINNDLGVLVETLYGLSTAGGGEDVLTYNLTPSNSVLFSELSGTTSSACGKNLSIALRNGSTFTKRLNFELTNKQGSAVNPNLNSYPSDGAYIVFINDYNVYDYYFFEGFTDIVHEQEKYLYKTGYKDYTRRDSSKRGVASSKTTEIHTCYTIVNEEASNWLSEIYRSKKVYLYESAKNNYVPLIVLDQEIQVRYANKTEVKPISMSFIKDVHVINK